MLMNHDDFLSSFWLKAMEALSVNGKKPQTSKISTLTAQVRVLVVSDADES